MADSCESGSPVPSTISCIVSAPRALMSGSAKDLRPELEKTKSKT